MKSAIIHVIIGILLLTIQGLLLAFTNIDRILIAVIVIGLICMSAIIAIFYEMRRTANSIADLNQFELYLGDKKI